MISVLLRGVGRLSGHSPAPAPPLSPNILRRLCDALAAGGPDGRAFKAALLFGIATFLRQSNFLPQTIAARGPHLIRRRDVTLSPAGLRVRVTSSKTIWDPARAWTIDVLLIPMSPYCPVAACRQAWRAAPASPNSLLFYLPSSGRPITAPALVAAIRFVLQAMRIPNANQYTVHSLRRTGVHLAERAGATLPDLMEHGSWTSGAVRAYLPPTRALSVPAAVAAALASGPRR